MLALCCDFVFLYFRSSARITVMCLCAHLDTVLPPSSSTFPLSIQGDHNNIIPLKYVHTNIIPISHVHANIMFFSLSKCDRTEKHSSQSNNQEKKFDMWNARETPENEICIDIDLLMIREIFKIVITWQKKNKNIYAIICKVQWMDGAKKTLYNQRGYDYQSYKLTK